MFLGSSGDFPGAEEELVYSMLSSSVPSSGSIVVFHIYVSPELEAATEPSRADPITIPSFL